jgi:hypothetical protein
VHTYRPGGIELAAQTPMAVARNPDPNRGCDHRSLRVIRLCLPYVEATMVRTRLVTETAMQYDVSPLYRINGGWALNMCRECAKRGLAIVIFVLVLALP